MRYGWLLTVLLMAACKDSDHDGVRDHKDCLPDDPRANPDATEVCDGVDNDCDGEVDEDVAIVAFLDQDGDGFGDDEQKRRVCELPDDGSEVGGDCDDGDPTVSPGAEEACNEVDDDCDGETDEGVTRTYYADDDGDGHGDATHTVEGCFTPDGYAVVGDDCDDGEPASWEGAAEVCDGIDNDCDGDTDEDLELTRQWQDLDGDGYGDPGAPVLACGPGVDVADNDLDCDDTDPNVSPDAFESRGNGADEDCDGWIDEYGVGPGNEFATVPDALAVAPDGSVIQLDAGLFTETIDLTGRDVTLAGEGCDRTTLYANGGGSGIVLDAGEVVGLTVSGGTGTLVDGALVGGGILARGSARIEEVCADNNHAAYGGGIAVVGGTLTIVDSRAWENTADVDGGGVYASPTATALVISRSRLLSNEATNRGGGVAVSGTHLQLTNSIVADNLCRDRGCGVDVDEHDLQTTPATAVGSVAALVNDTFHANASTQVFGPGVGVAVLSRASSTEIRNSLFTGHEDPGNLIEASNGVTEDQHPGVVTTAYLGFRGNAGADVDLDLYLTDRADGDPAYVMVDPSLPSTSWDFRLLEGSGMRAAGDTSLTNPDATRSDIGAFGGPNAPEGWDFGITDDSDADGMMDAWEVHFGTNPWVDDTADDDDGDGATNLEEHDGGSDPLAVDTDGDGVEDGVELTAGDRAAEAWDHAPIADAGADRYGLTGLSLDLVGGGTDPDADPLATTWVLVSQPAGSVATLSIAGATATLVADEPGDYVIELQVDDGTATSVDQVVVRAWDGVVVPDDEPDLASALAVVQDGQAIGLRAGTWRGTLDTSGRDVALVGLASADQVVLEGRGEGSVLAASGGRLALGHVTVQGGFATRGGGLAVQNLDGLDLLDVTLRQNHANDGGGAWIDGTATMARDLRVVDNVANDHGGGLAVGHVPTAVVLDLQRGLFQGNTARTGGGLWLDGGPSSTNADYHLDAVVFLDNSAQDGAAWAHTGGGSDARAEHLSASHNRGSSLFWADLGRDVFLGNTLDGNEVGVFFEEPGTLATFQAFGGVWDELTHPVLQSSAATPPDVGQWLEGQPELGLVVDDGDPTDEVLVSRGTRVTDSGFVEHLDADGSIADAGACAGPSAWRDCLRFTVDSDDDSLPDAWERAVGLNVGVDDATTDADGDGANALTELAAGTDPSESDTDADGVSDRVEVQAGDDPLSDRDHRPQVVLPAVVYADVGTPAALDATGSADPDGSALTSWQWRILAAPPGSTATILGGSGPVAGLTPDVVGTWRVGVTASDGQAPSREAVVWVTVGGTLTVPGDFATLDDAYQAAQPNDTILVAAGTWTTSFDMGDKPITIAGTGIDQTILVPPPNTTTMQVGTTHGTAEDLTLRDLTLAGGTSSSGGAVRCAGGNLHTERVLFRDNVGNLGGAVHLEDCAVDMVDTDFRYNHAASEGAALWVEGGTLVMTGGMLSQNETDGLGGGMYLTDADVELYNVQLHRNTSTDQGAAIWYGQGAANTASLRLDHVTGVGNIGKEGAFHRVDTTPTVIVDSLFVDNSAVGFTDLGGQVNLTMNHNGWSLNSQHTNPSSLSGGATDVRDPDHRLVAYDNLGEDYAFDDEDLRLTARSPFRDAGSDQDRDGSVGDMGAFGGPLARDGWDDEFVDNDSDGMPDTWEIEHGLDPATSNAGADPDADGLNNGNEFVRFGDPHDDDSDGDGVRDATDADNEDPSDNAPTVTLTGGAVNNAVVGTPVTRTATATDPQGNPVSFAWTLTDKPGRSALTTASLTGRTTATVGITPDVPGMYELTVVGSDAGGSGTPKSFLVRVVGDLAVPLDYATVDDAVFASWDGGVVHVGPGVWPAHVDFGGRDITLVGVGRDQTILDGQDRGRILSADGGEDIVVQSLTLRNGTSSRGGHLMVRAGAASAVLDDVTLENGRAGEGGSTYVSSGILAAAGVRIVDNVAAFRAGGVSVNSGATFTLDQALLADNRAEDNDGGAIRLFTSSLDAANVIFADNVAYRGGAVAAVTSGTITLDHVTATHDTAAFQGSVFMVGIGTDWTLTNSLLAYNEGAPVVSDEDTTASYAQTYALLDANATSATFDLRSSPDPVDGAQGNLIDQGYTIGLPGVSGDGDWTNDDWTLTAASDAVDAGDPASGRDTDNSRADMGAFGGPGGDFTP